MLETLSKTAKTMATTNILTPDWEAIVGTRDTHACAECGVLLQESITGMHRLDGKPVCSDCYFGDKMEEILRTHPIESPQ